MAPRSVLVVCMCAVDSVHRRLGWLLSLHAGLFAHAPVTPDAHYPAPLPCHLPPQVDAALDLSHTQNIGRMIKQHFPQSQVWRGRGLAAGAAEEVASKRFLPLPLGMRCCCCCCCSCCCCCCSILQWNAAVNQSHRNADCPSHPAHPPCSLPSPLPPAQFIVVSLKEGMFNNANVIFRTKFVDGVSVAEGGGWEGAPAQLLLPLQECRWHAAVMFSSLAGGNAICNNLPTPPSPAQVSTVTRTVNTAAGAGGQAGSSKGAAGRGRAALRENVRG